jgi:hypothetical protein
VPPIDETTELMASDGIKDMHALAKIFIMMRQDARALRLIGDRIDPESRYLAADCLVSFVMISLTDTKVPHGRSMGRGIGAVNPRRQW